MTDELRSEIYHCTKRLRTIQYPKPAVDLSKTEVIVIMQVGMHKKKHGSDTNVTTLCDLTCTSIQSLSRTLKNLEIKGYIKRKTDKENRRNTVVILTKEGKDLMNECHNQMDRFMTQVFSHFEDEEIENFISFEKKLYDVMKMESEKTNLEKL